MRERTYEWTNNILNAISVTFGKYELLFTTDLVENIVNTMIINHKKIVKPNKCFPLKTDYDYFLNLDTMLLIYTRLLYFTIKGDA